MSVVHVCSNAGVSVKDTGNNEPLVSFPQKDVPPDQSMEQAPISLVEEERCVQDKLDNSGKHSAATPKVRWEDLVCGSCQVCSRGLHTRLILFFVCIPIAMYCMTRDVRIVISPIKSESRNWDPGRWL